MATIQPSNRSASHENDYSLRSRGDNEIALSRNGPSIRGSEENHSPPKLPKAFESMLKTTTETGDIGLFSIKPPRVPQSLNSPRRIVGSYRNDTSHRPQNFQAYGTTGVDDRRRLPSYARDASSEVISMYETASQKSASRVFDDPDCRSYSMTQTYSTYSLSNHRSYASLRSQPEGTAILQRPRSPFAYPTRLKRPGFRPSSPALTDGGGIDYSRRAEIERAPQANVRGTSSPASLYAQKRKLPPSLRPDRNRSTPSLLSQSSPARRSSSPQMRQVNGTTPTAERQHQIPPGSVTTSPARSTFSLASTVNLYPTAPPFSTTTTPRKIPPPSPLYYDYTEDFEIEDYNRPDTLEPPPQFRIEKTIPEDRPLSSGWQFKDIKVHSDTNTVHRERCPASIYSIESSAKGQPPQLIPHNRRPDSPSIGSVFDLSQNNPSPDLSDANETLPENLGRDLRDKQVIRLSGLGVGAQELNSHVEEAFGLVPSPSFELLVPAGYGSGQGRESEILISNVYKFDPPETKARTSSTQDSSYALSTHQGQFTNTHFVMKPVHTVNNTETDSGNTQSDGSGIRNSGSLSNLTSQPLCEDSGGSRQNIEDAAFLIYEQSPPLGSTSRGLSHRMPTGIGITGMAELISTLKNLKGLGDDAGDQGLHGPTQKAAKTPLGQFDISASPEEPAPHRTDTSLLSTHQQSNRKSKFALPEQPTRWSDQRSRGRRIENATLPSYGDTDVPNFSHHFPCKLMSRSDSPMLAPKPISPARQLKLKNSVPQLMKALPPLPPEQPVRAVSPPLQLISSDEELPCRFSPLIPETKPNSVEERIQVPGPDPDQDSTQIYEQPTEPTELGSTPLEFTVKDPEVDLARSSSELPPKLKLKMRNSVVIRPLSPPDSRPWNLVENYPLSSQNLTAGLPVTIQDDRISTTKPPKFKLKITRASNSTLGTVRVNRESTSDSRNNIALHLRSPEDLFTPQSGIDGIFRQVSRHLYARRGSTSNNDVTLEDKSISPPWDETLEDDNSSPDLRGARLSPTSSTAPLKSPDARSCFSDDSSSAHGNIRNRLTNLRSRITVPYSSKMGSQSYDDLTWRDQSGAALPIPSAARSHPNLPSSRLSTDKRRTRRLTGKVRRQRLRAKVSQWFKGARSAIAARVKLRASTGRFDDEVLSR